jgi:branched-chain amino acid transport system ATP-binding protein
MNHPAPEQGPHPALEVEDLTVRYGPLTALDAVSLSVDDGEIVGIIGPNGAGKSSSFAGITNVVPRSGTVRLYGEVVDRLPTQVLARRGLRRTFQQNSFYSELTVLENAMAAFEVAHGTSLAGALVLPWRESRRRRSCRDDARQLLLDFGVDRRYHDRRPDDLPHGLQRSLSIVLSYGAGARVLLVDEPAAGVGGADMQALVDLLVRLRDQGLAIVLIEHHMDLVMGVVNRLTVIDRGRTIAAGAPSEVRHHPEVLAAYLGRTA